MKELRSYTATAKFLMVSPTKVRPIADLIRNKPYIEAMAILDTVTKKGGKFLSKAVKSAAHNAMNNSGRDVDEASLYVSRVEICEGPRMKRMLPGSQGRRYILLKRMSHIKVAVAEIAPKKEAK